MAVAVERGRVLEISWHAEEGLSEQERAEARGEERHCEPGVRVVDVEIDDGREVGDDGHLERDHQRCQEDDEQRSLERELEERERVRGERGRDDLTDHDDH